MEAQIDFSLFDSRLSQDPFPLFAQLREQGRVLRVPNVGMWVVSGYAEAQTVLKNWELFSSAGGMGGMMGVQRSGFGQTMLFADPPDHTRLRGVVSRAFTPKSVAALESRIAQIADDLLADMRPGEPFDVVGRLAVPLPITVIAEMLGVDPKDRGDFKRWSSALVGFADFATGRSTTEELNAYFLRVIDERRQDPREDLISRMVQANQDDVLTPEELMSACILLLIAGNETTTNLIGQATLALARHPAELRRLVDEPALIANGIEEVLRWDGPVQAIPPRTATADVDVGGVTLTEGSNVFVLLGAANRDPAQFMDAERFDVTRDNAATNVAFGAGIHFCLGAPLARLESRVAMGAFLKRAGVFTLANPDDPADYQPNFFLRALKKLEILPQS